MVQRTSVRGISRYGRASQGVNLMNLREDDRVSAVALVVDDSAETAAKAGELLGGPVEASDVLRDAGPPPVDGAPPVDPGSGMGLEGAPTEVEAEGELQAPEATEPEDPIEEDE